MKMNKPIQANDIVEGMTMTNMTGLLPADRDGKVPRINPRKVFKVLAVRTGLVRVSAYPVGSKVNKVVKSSFFNKETNRNEHIMEEVPSGLEIWEIPRDWVVAGVPGS